MEILCLDTDILIDLLRGKNKDEIEELEKRFDLATTSINLFELYYGAYRTGRKRNIDAVKELAERIEVFEFTSKSAELAGKILAELVRKGEMIDFRDVMIAGIVIENYITLYTRNVKHFKRIKGLKLL